MVTIISEDSDNVRHHLANYFGMGQLSHNGKNFQKVEIANKLKIRKI